MLYKQRNSIFDPPSLREKIFARPVQYLIRLLFQLFNAWRPLRKPSNFPIRIVCISDTHTKTCAVPEGDVLIHAGDLTNKGTTAEIQHQIEWLSSLPHPYKIAIAGNHDTWLDPKSRQTLSVQEQKHSLDWGGVHYLQHDSITLHFAQDGVKRSIKVYGAPQIPHCGGADFAFQYAKGLDAWTETIPADVDVLVTHTPPKYHLDLFTPSLGCEFLLRECWRVKPQLQICGHIHAGAGREILRWDDGQAAYEQAMVNGDSKSGCLPQIFSLTLWKDAARVIYFGLCGILWDRVWGGSQQSTLLINAALMKPTGKTLRNEIQTINF